MIVNALNALAITVPFLCLLWLFWQNISHFVLAFLFAIFLINGGGYVYNLAGFQNVALALSFVTIMLKSP